MPVSWQSRLLPLLGDRDVLDHGAEHGAAGGVGLGRHQPLEAALDVGRQQLDRADVERLGDLFDFLRIELHRGTLRSWEADCTPPRPQRHEFRIYLVGRHPCRLDDRRDAGDFALDQLLQARGAAVCALRRGAAEIDIARLDRRIVERLVQRIDQLRRRSPSACPSAPPWRSRR